jgi:hypothetical protein
MRDEGEKILGWLTGLRDNIIAFLSPYIGEKSADWLIAIIVILALWGVCQSLSDVTFRWVYARRNAAEEKRLYAEFERDEKRRQQEEDAEWTAFTNWVIQNPSTAERLMCIVDYERCQRDPEWLRSEHRAWFREQREARGD